MAFLSSIQDAAQTVEPSQDIFPYSYLQSPKDGGRSNASRNLAAFIFLYYFTIDVSMTGEFGRIRILPQCILLNDRETL